MSYQRDRERAQLAKDMGLHPDPGQRANNGVIAYEEGNCLVFNHYATMADAKAHEQELAEQRTSLRRAKFQGDVNVEAFRRVLATTGEMLGKQ